jgi:NAD(P)H dehydrogenase (quinone)
MKVLYVYCHPLPESYHAAIRAEATGALAAAGHEVDLLDLYAEGFDPVLQPEARRHYHDPSCNRKGLESYVARLLAAEALVVQFPSWCFGPPAMLKGFFDRLLMPGVAFDLSDPTEVRPLLGNITRLVGIVTYGRPRSLAMAMGDPPRRIVTRYLAWFIARRARRKYLALYHMNVSDERQRARFLAKIRTAMIALEDPE